MRRISNQHNKPFSHGLVVMILSAAVMTFALAQDEHITESLPPGALTVMDSRFEQWYQEAASEPDKVVAEVIEFLVKPGRTQLELAQGYWLLSDAQGYLGLAKDALTSSQRGLDLVSEESQPWLYRNLQLSQATALNDLGRHDAALPLVDEVAKWAEDHHDQNTLVEALILRGMVESEMANYLLALQDLQQAYQLSREQKDGMGPGEIAGFLARVYENRGEPELAQPYFEEWVRFARQTGRKMELSMALYGLAKVQAEQGRIDRPRGLFQRSLEIAENIGDQQGVAFALLELANLDIKQQQWQSAQARLETAAKTFHNAGNIKKQIDVALAEINLWLVQDKPHQAEKAWEQARKWAQQMDAPRLLNRMQFVHARLLAAQKRYAQAYHVLEAAQQERTRLLQEKSTSQLHFMRARYELENSQTENALLAKQNQLQAAQLKAQARESLWQDRLLLFFSLLIGLLIYVGWRFRHQRQRFQWLATHDHLTGLINRGSILQKAQQVFHDDCLTDCGLALIDFDNFKQINDRFGHLVGDNVLKEFGAICRQVLAGEGQVGRVGGEEFLLVLPVRNLPQVMHMLEELSRLAKNIPQRVGLSDMPVSLSIGVALLDRRHSLTNHFDAIDNALYRAKRMGKNRIEIADMDKNGETPPSAQ